MELKAKKSEREVWEGSYNGISFEINRFKSKDIDGNDKYSWCHYIFVNLDRIPDETIAKSFWLKGKVLFSNRISYDYYKAKWCDVIDFHGGCTWYSKESGFDGSPKIVKIGCDYQHLWDEGFEYDLGYVESEVLRTIESFRAYIPNYKFWCRGNGELCDLSEGILDDNGSFYSYKYWGDKPIWKKLTKQAESVN